MSSPPNLRGPQLTPIPENISQLAAPVYNPLSPSSTDMETITTRSPGLDMSYFDVPDNAPAIFSTCIKSQPKRKLEKPYPPVIVRTNLLIDVQRKCDNIRQRFPEHAGRVAPGINDWYKLYSFFDAVDLWVEGPAFCFNVIYRLGARNIEMLAENRAQIAAFAQNWVQANAKRLLIADHVEVLGLISYDECLKEEFNLMSNEDIEILRQELNRFRDILLQSYRAARPPLLPTGPSHSSQYMVSPPRAPLYTQSSVSSRCDQVVPSELDHTITRAPQTYNNITEYRRNLHGHVEPSSRDSRNRGWSNDTNRGGRGPRFSNGGQNNTSRTSPPRHEPVYVLTSHRGVPADMVSLSRQNIPGRPRTYSGTRNFSNDVRNTSYSRRTVSEETSNRPFYNYSSGSRPYNQHSRAPSNSSAVVESSYPSTGVNQNGSEGYETTVDTGNSNPDFCENLVIDHYPYTVSPNNGSVTIFYLGETRKVLEQPLQTVYVSGVPLSLFVDHTFREMMSECGEVDTISHLRNRPGSAFVLFRDETAVQRAIDKFHGFPIGDGPALRVSVPDKSRQRGYSMSSFNGDRENRHGRNQFRGPSGNYTSGHARTISTNVAREPFRLPIPEIPENLGAQSHWKPLQDSSNVSPNKRSILQNATGRPYFQPSTAASSPKKENSPMPTPSRSVMQTPKSKSKSKKTLHNSRKTSQQNSKQPTPIGSPKRPLLGRMSTSENIKGGEAKEQNRLQQSDQILLHEHVAQRLMSAPPSHLNQDKAHDAVLDSAAARQVRLAAAHKATEQAAELATNDQLLLAECALPAETVPKAKVKNKSKKKGNSNNTKNMGAPLAVDSFSDTISPIDNNNGSFNGNASTNTSFSTPSSRQPSVNATSRKARDLSQKVDETLDATFQITEPSQNKKTAKEGLSSVQKTKNINRKPSKNRDATGESVLALVTGHRKNLSTSSVTSSSSQRKADMVRNVEQQISTSAIASAPIESDISEAVHQQETIMTPSPTTKAKEHTVDRPPISIVIPSPIIRIADVAESQVSSPVVSSGRTAQSPKSISEHLVSPRSLPEIEKSPKQLTEQDWPVLASSKSPVPAIVDGKPPTPIRAPLMKLMTKAMPEKSPEVKKVPKSTFPPVAVPRHFESSRSTATKSALRPPTQDEEGSETWPFVRRFKAR